MNEYRVYIHTRTRNYVTSTRANSPKDAAIICCTGIAANNNIKITKDKLSKGINRMNFKGTCSNLSSPFIKVDNYKTGAVYNYRLACTIDKRYEFENRNESHVDAFDILGL